MGNLNLVNPLQFPAQTRDLRLVLRPFPILIIRTLIVNDVAVHQDGDRMASPLRLLIDALEGDAICRDGDRGPHGGSVDWNICVDLATMINSALCIIEQIAPIHSDKKDTVFRCSEYQIRRAKSAENYFEIITYSSRNISAFVNQEMMRTHSQVVQLTSHSDYGR